MHFKNTMVGKGHYFRWKPGSFFPLRQHTLKLNGTISSKPLIRTNSLRVKLFDKMVLVLRALIYSFLSNLDYVILVPGNC